MEPTQDIKKDKRNILAKEHAPIMKEVFHEDADIVFQFKSSDEQYAKLFQKIQEHSEIPGVEMVLQEAVQQIELYEKEKNNFVLDTLTDKGIYDVCVTLHNYPEVYKNKENDIEEQLKAYEIQTSQSLAPLKEHQQIFLKKSEAWTKKSNLLMDIRDHLGWILVGGIAGLVVSLLLSPFAYVGTNLLSLFIAFIPLTLMVCSIAVLIAVPILGLGGSGIEDFFDWLSSKQLDKAEHQEKIIEQKKQDREEGKQVFYDKQDELKREKEQIDSKKTHLIHDMKEAALIVCRPHIAYAEDMWNAVDNMWLKTLSPEHRELVAIKRINQAHLGESVRHNRYSENYMRDSLYEQKQINISTKQTNETVEDIAQTQKETAAMQEKLGKAQLEAQRIAATAAEMAARAAEQAARTIEEHFPGY